MKRDSLLTKYGYFWVTLVLFLGSLVGHWTFAWQAYVDEQVAHGQPIEVNQYLSETLRDTFENWQSEFLQLIWQVAGLAYLFYLGSPQSKEGDERVEEKIDILIKLIDGKGGPKLIDRIDEKYARS